MIRAALLLALVAGCGSVTMADPQADAAAADVGSAGRRAEGGTGGAAGEVAPPADAGAAGARADAGPDYGPAPGPRPDVPDGGWVGGVVGNCYDVRCANGGDLKSNATMCAPGPSGAECLRCTVAAPGPACVAVQNGPTRWLVPSCGACP